MKKLFLTLSLALASLSGYAQEWIDVTDTYVINPRFDGDDIILLRRTAYRGAHNYHDANRLTFHRFENWRRFL